MAIKAERDIITPSLEINALQKHRIKKSEIKESTAGREQSVEQLKEQLRHSCAHVVFECLPVSEKSLLANFHC